MMNINGYRINPAVLGALGGLAVGSLGTLLVARHVYERQAQAEVDAIKQHYDTRLAQALEAFERRNADRSDSEASVGDAELGEELEGDEAAAAAERIDAITDGLDEQEAGNSGNGKWADVVKETLNSDAEETSDHPARTNYSVAHRVAGQQKPDLAALAASVQDGAMAVPTEYERDTTKPYVISVAEFFEDNKTYQKLTITYYTADKVLVDDKDVPITDILRTVGLGIHKFGEQSDDENIVYVRNDRLELDFEIVKDERSYTEVVLGYGDPKAVKARR